MVAYFITSSGTGVGKTLVTAALACQLKRAGSPVLALKPVVSGYDPADAGSDTALLLQAQGLAATPANAARISPFRFAAALAPCVAAKREGKTVSLAAVVAHCKREMETEGIVLIEGVGGVMAPISETETVLDWMRMLNLPSILVVGSYLGALSHALTAYAALVHAGMTVAAVVVSQSEQEPMPLADTVASLRGCVAGQVPVVPLPRVQALPAYLHCPSLVALCKNY